MGPLIKTRGEGSPILECEDCGHPLAVGVKTSQLANIVFKCPKCGAFNETIE